MDEVPAGLAEKISKYKSPESAQTLVRETKLLMMAGTAGSGKNAIMAKLLSTKLYERIVSHTTRQPRINDGRMEETGVDFHFIDQATIEPMVDDNRFVEVKIVHKRNIYGTSLAEIQRIHDAGKIGVTDIDVQGVAEYVKLNPQIKAVFLLPPSFDEWMHRLAQRGEMDQDEIKIRLETAQLELEHALKAGHFHFVINADLEKAVDDVRQYAEDPNYELKNDETKVEHAWHVLGELKHNLNT
jgi:guanylate kinase